MKRPAGQTTGVPRVGDGAGDPAIGSPSGSRPEGSAPGRDLPTYRRPPWDKRHLVLVWATLTGTEQRCLRSMGSDGGRDALASLVTMGLLTPDGARTPKGQAVLREGGK